MISRRILSVLVVGLPILIVVFSVLMAFYTLVAALGDASAAQVLLWIGVGCLILIVADLVLLVGCLGIETLQRGDEESGEG